MTPASGYSVAVLKTGQIFVGKLQRQGSSWPVMEDVMYVQRVMYKDNPVPQDSVVERFREWHAPDRMILNAELILFVEPVAKESTIMHAIEAAHQRKK